ncbi:cellulose synthase (UDP-forming) [Friedmanniella endophytica]|uniref:Cellulose synthase (UDP-forming) n=1 Tax=Microlunatus kandeliicorticis TaxID=1759536 RepID=A0A7W3IVW9_9ACTN|nr:glycosyltransferase family 2 protein [Microlunatus kandeliicorticis]MBA8796090.1 cellulose synthase (UDP-forming) [Microlunatus kandeliicorticis]
MSTSIHPARADARRARVAPVAPLASWAALIGPPGPEGRRSRLLARFGGFVAVTVLAVYVTWRILFTLPSGTFNLVAAWLLIAFELLPLPALVIRLVNQWNIDNRAPRRVLTAEPDRRTVIFIPTYNEPVEVIAPTITAACRLEPAHQTWVLDDGDRPWVADLCRSLGARYVTRTVHDHAKAGNMNHALELMAEEEAAGAEPLDVVAVLDCDHVPLPTFLTDTLGWFDDPRIALVQGPQNYYNAGAFDDDGETGEQGVFFHVQLAARNHDGAGPFWCGSTALVRTAALREIGGVDTRTIVEDMHTTLGLLKAGWKTAYHHQTLAVGLAPDTPGQYLLQRRRWGLGCMQVLVLEKLWAAKRWLGWRNFYEYLTATVWWLEGVATVFAFLVPAIVLVSGATTSTLNPLLFTAVFLVQFAIRMWGVQRLFRGHLKWRSAFALRILRIPIGLSCAWWLLTRRELTFQVTPKSGADQRVRGTVPRILWWLLGVNVLVVVYAFLGLTDAVPWKVSPPSVGASGVWLALSGLVLVLGIRRIQQDQYLTSRRNAYRVPVRARVSIGGRQAELVDVSMGGAAVLADADLADAVATQGALDLVLPGADPVLLDVIRQRPHPDGGTLLHLRVRAGDWNSFRALAVWLFHTPAGVVEGLPPGVPAVAAIDPEAGLNPRTLIRQQT